MSERDDDAFGEGFAEGYEEGVADGYGDGYEDGIRYGRDATFEAIEAMLNDMLLPAEAERLAEFTHTAFNDCARLARHEVQEEAQVSYAALPHELKQANRHFVRELIDMLRSEILSAHLRAV